jgi:hypothetical protein
MIVVGQFVDVHPLDLDDASTRNMPGGLTSIAAVTDRLRLVGVQPPLEFEGDMLTASRKSLRISTRSSSAKLTTAPMPT